MAHDNLFPWQEDGGYGLHVEQNQHHMVKHEVLSENAVTTIDDRNVYMGQTFPLRRFRIVGGIMLGILCLLFGRAFWMQIVSGASYQLLAEHNRLNHETLVARRGVIRDHTGIVLAENTPSFDIRVTPRDLPKDGAERDELLGTVARTIGISIGDIDALIASSTDMDDAVVVKRDIPYDQALSLRILFTGRPGILVAIQSKRHYPVSSEILSLAHILGYVGGISPQELAEHRGEGYRQTDLYGKTGIEESFETRLRGTPGERVYEVDAQNRVTGVVGEQMPIDGQDVRLTIDLELQRAAEQALRRELDTLPVKRGAVIALDPRDGAIRAIVSWPGFDNNLFSGSVSATRYAELINNPDHPLVPRAWAGVYPSGSTIKPVIATAALAEGVINPQTSVVSTGGLQVGPWFFPDWKPGGHGVTNVRKAIAWSVNTFFYYVGGGYHTFVGLGVDRLTDWMRRFGLGSKTGLDVAGESSGFVPSKDWKLRTKGEPWYIGDTYNLSIGQGDLLVTPLHVAVFTAIVANGGHKIVPHLFADASPSSTTQAPIASSEVIHTVQLGMRDTVIYGSGVALSNLSVPVAGKTGTAQWRSDKANHAWFTAYAPFDHPELVVTVLIEEGEEGSRTAIPVAREILAKWFDTSHDLR